MGIDLGLFQLQQSQATHVHTSALHKRMEEVRASTAWALFNFQLLVLSLPEKATHPS